MRYSVRLGQGDIKCGFVDISSPHHRVIVLKKNQGKAESEKVEFLGRRIDHLPVESIVELGISHVPEGRQIFPDLTVKENLLMGAYTRKPILEI